MILCLCRGISDRAVEAAIADGASTVAQIERACGAGGDCGACGDLLDALVERARHGHYGGAAQPTNVLTGGIHEGARSGGEPAQRHPHGGADRHQPVLHPRADVRELGLQAPVEEAARGIDR
ncbi:MAG: (2Fe-2S)-binding protein [Candidatus Rokuibacteriota bacterium]